MRTQPWLRTPGTLAGALVPWMPRPSLGSPRRTNTGPSGFFGPGGTLVMPFFNSFWMDLGMCQVGLKAFAPILCEPMLVCVIALPTATG